jgi:Putative amidoligase enzyme
VPQSRRGNRFCRSNWLDGQYLGKSDKSRSDSIAAVDGVPVRNEVQDMNCIIELMQNLDDRDYCWNFNNICWGKGTIEFRKPPASTTAEEALGWAELVMSFVQASIKNGVCEKLKKVPPNVGGLKWFLKQAYEPGVNEAYRLDVIWKDIPDSAALEPQLWVKEYWGEESRRLEGRLNSLAMADKQKATEFAKTAKKPYW